MKLSTKLYFKRFVNRGEKPVIVHPKNEFDVVDCTVRKDELGKKFNPEEASFVERITNHVVRNSGGVELRFKGVYVGKETYTYTFSKNLVVDSELSLD